MGDFDMVQPQDGYPETGDDTEEHDEPEDEPESQQQRRQQQDAADDDGDEAWDPDRARRTIERLRQYEKEAKANKRAAAEAQAKLKAYQDKEKSEAERMQERVEELERERETAQREAREARVRMAVAQEAQRLDVIDADAAFKLMDESHIEIDDYGNVTGVDTAIKELIKLRPFLKRQPAPSRSGSEFGGNGSNGKPSREEVQKLAKTNPDEFNRRWEAGEFQDVFNNTG